MAAAPVTEPTEPQEGSSLNLNSEAGDVAGAAAELSPPEAAAPAAPAIVKIHDQDVEMAVLQRHFDPRCPDRCVEGVRMVGRPVPRGFKGVVRVPELCACTVRGYLREHPPAAAAPVLGAAARALIAAVRPARSEDRGARRLSKIEAEIAEEERALEGVRARLSSAVGPLEAARAEAEADAIAARAKLDASEDENGRVRAAAEKSKAELSAEIEQLRARLSGAQAQLHQATERLAAAELEERSFALRRAEVDGRAAARVRELDSAIVGARARIAPAFAAAEKRLEKLRRRATTIRAYHPAVPAPADGAPATSEAAGG